MMSLLATLGTRRCRVNGDAERNVGLEDVEAGVGVAEVGGGRKLIPLWETDGTLGLPTVTNLAFIETDGRSRDGGDVDKLSMLWRFETEATRVLGATVRWPRPVTESDVPGSFVVEAFALADSLVTFEVIRMDGVGLG